MKQRILVAGATGKTGTMLVHELLNRGAAPVALVRESSDTSALPEGVDLRKGDLTDLPADVCADIDAVVFAAGSGGDTSEEMTDKVDRKGAKHLIDIAKDSGVERFVMLSSIGADAPPEDHPLAQYLKAKHDADTHLMSKDMTHAILRPVALTDGAKTGLIRLGEAVDREAEATRADVAATLAEAVTAGTYDGKALDMQSAA